MINTNNNQKELIYNNQINDNHRLNPDLFTVKISLYLSPN